MKKLSLDRAWELCIAQWDEGVMPNLGKDSVEDLKIYWLERRGYKNFPEENCFFCEYARREATKAGKCWICAFCPGVLISPRFGCDAKTYQWERHPRAFHRKIHELYKQYKESK